MQYRRLGGTDLDVSVICLGPMRAAEKEPCRDEKSRAGERAFRRALDLAVTFLHSSYEYGTRWMMERVLKDHPKRADLRHVIKVPVPDFADGDRFDATKFLLRSEEALRDLHAERIAVLQWMRKRLGAGHLSGVNLLIYQMDDSNSGGRSIRWVRPETVAAVGASRVVRTPGAHARSPARLCTGQK